jgi:hypothetical protein
VCVLFVLCFFDVSQNTPEISQNTPEISQNTPEFSQNTPESSQISQNVLMLLKTFSKHP